MLNQIYKDLSKKNQNNYLQGHNNYLHLFNNHIKKLIKFNMIQNQILKHLK